MEGNVKNVQGGFFFVEVPGLPDIFCRYAQVNPPIDKVKIIPGAVVSFDSTQDNPGKSPNAVGDIKLISAATAASTPASTPAKGGSKDSSKQVAVEVTFPRLDEMSDDHEYLQVMVKLSSGGNPLVSWKVSLDHNGLSVITPLAEPLTTAGGTALFYATVKKTEQFGDFFVIVHDPSGGQREFHSRWDRISGPEAPKVNFLAEKFGAENGIYTFKISYSPKAVIGIQATQETLWRYKGADDKAWKPATDAPQLDDQGVAIIEVKVETGIGAEVIFSSGGETSPRQWLNVHKTKTQLAVGGSEQNYGNKNTFWDKVSSSRRRP